MTVANIIWKEQVAAASLANVAGTFADANLGPGDTLTSTAGAALVVDGYTVKLNDRVLLKNQTAGLQNGLYALTQSPVAGSIATTGAIVQPTGGTIKNGTYFVQPTGGSGSGATLIVQVAGNAVTGVFIAQPGLGYTAGDVLTYSANGQGYGNGGTATVGTVTTWPTAANTGNSGAILTITSFTQPSSVKVTDGTYGLMPLTGGSGTGAVGTITITGGVVTSVTISNPGSGYTAGNVLGFSGTPGTATQGLGTGGTIAIPTITFTPWVLTRTSDANFAFGVEAMAAFINNGTQANTAWVQNQLTVTLDTTALTFVELVV